MSRRKQAKPQHINSEEQPPDAASGKGGPRCFAARLMRGGGSGAISGAGGLFFTLVLRPLLLPPSGSDPCSPLAFWGRSAPLRGPTAELLHGAARTGVLRVGAARSTAPGALAVAASGAPLPPPPSRGAAPDPAWGARGAAAPCAQGAAPWEGTPKPSLGRKVFWVGGGREGGGTEGIVNHLLGGRK